MAVILVIEDESTCQFYLKNRLSKMGHEDVVFVETGDEAVEILKCKTFDVILSDLMVPGSISGIEMIEKFRELAPDTGIAIISGYPEEDVIVRCQQIGVRDFLTKPFELGFVPDIVNKIIAKKNNDK
ncbi:MAG: response regulator [Kiritimatiellae bacterium]|jgi:DNA-binding NtrC family response regulator|nr:response regulator [Kiritimatiellia bacterium]